MIHQVLQRPSNTITINNVHVKGYAFILGNCRKNGNFTHAHHCDLHSQPNPLSGGLLDPG